MYFSYAHVGSDEGGVFKSLDGGNSWFQVSNGLPQMTVAPHIGEYCPINKLLIDPNSPDTIYAGIGNESALVYGSGCWGVLKSVNGGINWSRATQPFGHGLPEDLLYDLAFNPDNSNVIYAGTARQSVYVSSDAGLTWEEIPLGVENIYDIISDLAIIDTSPQNLYLGMNDEGIFRLTIPPALGVKPISGIPPIWWTLELG